MAEKMRGMGGLSKMGTEADKMPKPKPMAEKKEPTMHEPGEEKMHTLTEHGDGRFTSHMHGAEPVEHPDHLHALAHMAHHVTGGDKHHMTHHDGMAMHSHGIQEDGQHQETQDHASADEAGEGLKQFMGEGEQDGQQSDDGSMGEMEPAYGGMSA
jgi:hypothetical protein